MKYTKHFLAMLLAMIAICAYSTRLTAGEPTYQNVPLVVVTPIPANTLTNLATPLFIDCSKQRNVAIELNFSSNGNSNVVWYLGRAVNSGYDTNNPITITSTAAAAGGNNKLNTNYDSLGYQGFYLYAISNNNTGTLTNSFYYGNKISGGN